MIWRKSPHNAPPHLVFRKGVALPAVAVEKSIVRVLAGILACTEPPPPPQAYTHDSAHKRKFSYFDVFLGTSLLPSLGSFDMSFTLPRIFSLSPFFSWLSLLLLLLLLFCFSLPLPPSMSFVRKASRVCQLMRLPASPVPRNSMCSQKCAIPWACGGSEVYPTLTSIAAASLSVSGSLMSSTWMQHNQGRNKQDQECECERGAGAARLRKNKAKFLPYIVLVGAPPL